MPPFTVLHVCTGNICRSPMAERLLAHQVGQPGLVFSHSAGTGGWHEGQSMNPPAARQLRERGVDSAGFHARQLRKEHIESSDLVLTATAEHLDYVLELCPDAAARSFVLGEFGRLLTRTPIAALPSGGFAAELTHARGVALVAASDAERGDAVPEPGDDLDDPYGGSDRVFRRIAEEIDSTLSLLSEALLPERRDA